MKPQSVTEYRLFNRNKVVCRNGLVPRVVIVSLFVTLCMVSTALAGDGITNQVSSADMVIENVKPYLPEIRGNAIWDLIKLLLGWGLKLILLPAIFLLLVKIPSMFSQRMHVSLFIKGSWRGLLWFSGVKPFGRLVDKSETWEYRKFDSPARKRVIDALNAHSGVFLVMGPPGVGKSLMVRAESKAKYVLTVEWDAWYDYREDDLPIKKILKERTTLLVRNLIFKKPVWIVLGDPLGEQEIPHGVICADRSRILSIGQSADGNE